MPGRLSLSEHLWTTSDCSAVMRYECPLVVLPGLTPYRMGLALQQEAYRAVATGEYPGVVFLLQHMPVYTLGANGGIENLKVSKAVLEKDGVDVVSVRRGGNVTYHGPGQLVVYPVLNLNLLGRDLRWYVGTLEESVIETLADYNVVGSRKAEYRGAWVGDRKIAAVGVQFKRWISLHGLAFNISVAPDAFTKINPCGISEFGVCSLSEFAPNPSMSEVGERLLEKLVRNLKITPLPTENPWEGVEEIEQIDV